MRRPIFITRRRVKWLGAFTALVIAAAMLLSNSFVLLWRLPGPTAGVATTISIQPGVLMLARSTPRSVDPQLPAFTMGAVRLYDFRKAYYPPPYRWQFDYTEGTGGPPATRNVQIPLWFLFTLTALPTAFLFYKSRRPPPGLCINCRYDLTGLRDDRCPECGTKITRPAAAALPEAQTPQAD